MDTKILKILIVEDNPGDARLLQETLQEVTTVKWNIVVAAQLSDAVECLETNSFDMVLLDLSLPDSQGLETCMSLHAKFPDTPLIVLTGLDDEELALRALHQGAQDYLVKGKADSNLLMRSIRYGIERKKIESDSLRSQKLKSLEAVAEGMAHEFNNILSSVLGNLSLAKVSLKPNNKIYENINRAEESVFKARDLTKQFLSLTKGGEPVRKSTSIGTVLKESARTALGESNIMLQFSIQDDLWSADVDQAQISQVINNLVSDGSQNLPKGGLISISAKNIISGPDDPMNLNPGSKYIKIELTSKQLGVHSSDSGQQIHDPFFSSSKDQGSGLRLATAHSIVEKHGGYIESKADIGSSTNINIYLPALDEKQKSKKKAKDKLISGKGKILIMEDDVMVRDTVIAMLQRLGYETDYADNAEDTVQIYSDSMNNGKPFDAVLIDLTIYGELQGVDAIDNLREADPNVKGILSTGYLNNDIIDEYKERGFVDLLQKPYDMQELSKTLDKIINK